MKTNVPGVMWPPVLLGRHATIQALVSEFRTTERLDPAELRQAQEMQLGLLIRHHAQHTPHFKARLAKQSLKASDLSGLQGLRKLDVIRKRDIQMAGPGFTCSAIPEEHMPCGDVSTSGSTGEPVTFQRSAINQLFWEAHVFRDHEWNGRSFHHNMAAIRATVDGFGIYETWGNPVGRFYNTGKAMVINVGETIEFQLEKLSEFRPGILIAHGGVLQGLVTHWERHGYDLELAHIKNIGDNCHDELRARIKAVTGLTVEDNYSSSEAGLIALQCPEGGQFHVMSETCLVEILNDKGEPCAPGEIGHVVLTDLQNFASPIIRYDIGDYAEVGDGCSCGRTLPTLKKIIGRERNLFHRPDGTRFWPRAGMHEMPKIAPIRQWQMIQHEIDHVEYRFVVDEPLSEQQKEKLRDLVPKYLLYKPDKISITEFTDAIPTRNGKYEETICYIK